MPILSDEALIKIQDFPHLALNLFEGHCSEQLEGFYQSLWEDSPELDLGGFSGRTTFIFTTAPPASFLAAFVSVPLKTPYRLLPGNCSPETTMGRLTVFDLGLLGMVVRNQSRT